MTKLADVIQRGTNAARPAATDVPIGTLYYDTDNSSLGRSNGTTWDSVEGSGAGSGSITASGYTQNTSKLLGRTTASSGAIEEISVGSGLTLSAGSISATGGASFNSYDSLISGMSGLVHRWKFEEASGNFADSVGSLTLTKSGTVTYAVAGGPVSGASGSCTFGASAKGTSGSMGSIPVGSAARTIVTIFKASTGKQTLWSYGTSGSTRQFFTAYVNDGASNAVSGAVWADDIVYGNGTTGVNPGPRSADGLYHMHAMMADGSNNFLYLFFDGAHTFRNLGGALNTVDSGTHFQVGLDIAAGNQSSATYDDIAVFTRVLAPYELNLLYAALAGQLP